MSEAQLIPGTLAQDCYPASAQAFYDEMFQKGAALIPDFTGLLIQDAAPDPSYRGNKGWIPTSGGVPIYPGAGVFLWHPVVGHWVARPYKGASDPRPEPYFGDLVDLPTFDGGDAGAPGIGSGPMWEQWTAIEGRVPVGAGTIPGSGGRTIANLATSDSGGGSGAYTVSLTPDQIQHMHGVGQNPAILDPTATDDPALQLHRAWDSGANTYTSSGNDMNPTSASGYTDGPAISSGIFGTTKALADPDFPTVDGHPNMQPYLGIYWIKRTARQFYIAG